MEEENSARNESQGKIYIKYPPPITFEIALCADDM
jgi:hypothetical protein